ncbi:MAG TPA: archaetidylserine decarboxylase [Gammaproteobacteria bacterium]|nr:archaetidylserine decarboxylase [Gammaproteobacteria bacterium]
MPKKLFIFCQYLLPQVLLTRFAGWMAERTWPPLKNWLIQDFIRRYQVNLNLAVSDKLEAYPCFNAFFTRALKASARPIDAKQDSLVNPVDGCLSQIGQLDQSKLLQAKGHWYSLKDLLGISATESSPFENGLFATFYLAPKDYHRVHLPFAGRLIQTTYIPGKLFSVNLLATKKIPNLFARNERLVCYFETAAGPMAVIFIGAMLVGKIQTVWGGVEYSREIFHRHYSEEEELRFEKGAEIGRFLMGSSVIVLFGKDRIEWLPQLQATQEVKMGESLGNLK